MNDLQIVLIVIGGVIIASVLIFNWWQERKFHQQIDKNFSAFQQDIPEIDNQISETSFDAHISPVADAQEFTIDPQRFLNEPSVEDEPTIAPETAAEYETAPENMPEQDAETAFTSTANIDEEDVSISAQPISAQHSDIKAIIENAFVAPVANQVETNPDERISAEPVSVETTSENAPPENVASSLPSMLHSQIDWAALLYLQGAASVQEVLASLKDGFSHYDKPTFVHVLTEQGWLLASDIADKPEYSALAVSKICCSIQLADRAGPISRSVLNRFQLAVESLGLDINAHVEWQNAGDALNDANALDQFCIEVDKTMGFHLLHGETGAFTGTKLRGLAEAQGMALASDGAFKFFDESAQTPAAGRLPQPCFVMFNRDHNPFSIDMLRTSVVKSITFQLDIPHVSHCIEAFNNMVLVAKQMETGLNAQLVDDNNRPLTDTQIEKIRHQLKIIQATMLTRDIAPGSDCARRLFS